MSENKENITEVELSEFTKEKILFFIKQRDFANQQIENFISIYLDAKGVETDSKIIDFDTNFTKIILTNQ